MNTFATFVQLTTEADLILSERTDIY